MTTEESDAANLPPGASVGRLRALFASADQHSAGLRLALGGVGVQALLRIGVVAATARLVAPADTGLFQIAFSLVTLAMALFDPGLSETMARQRVLSRASASAATALNLMLGLAAAGALLAFAPAVATFSQAPESADVIRALAVLPPLSALAAGSAAQLRRKRRFSVLVLIETAGCAAGAIAAVWVGLAGGGWWALAAFQFASFALRAVCAFAAEPVLPRFAFRRRALLRTARFSFPAWAMRLLSQTGGNVDKLIIGAVLGTSALGLFSRASLFVAVPVQLIGAATASTLVPSYSALRSEPAKLSDFFVRSSRLTASIVFPVFFGAAALAEPIVSVLLSAGAPWDWSDAAMALAALAPAAAFDALIRQHRSLEFAIGRPRQALAISAAQTAVVLAATWAGAATAQLLGAACGYAIATALCFAPSLFLAAREARTPLLTIVAVLAGPFAAATLMAASVAALALVATDAGLSPFLQIAVLAPVGALLYAAVLMLAARKTFAAR